MIVVSPPPPTGMRTMALPFWVKNRLAPSVAIPASPAPLPSGVNVPPPVTGVENTDPAASIQYALAPSVATAVGLVRPNAIATSLPLSSEALTTDPEARFSTQYAFLASAAEATMSNRVLLVIGCTALRNSSVTLLRNGRNVPV